VVRYRFGTFELDGRSGELRKNGVRLRLQEQPFLVLRKLLEGSGDLVSREDLHAAVWQADTFVDFDTSLNTAIKRLREALGDSADVPVFIETVPRRGYRFLAPVKILRNGNGAVPAVEASAPAPMPATSGRKTLPFLAAGIFFVVAVVAVGVVLRTPRPEPHVLDTSQMTFGGMPKGNARVGGGFIYYNEDRGDGRVALMKIPLTGGTPTFLDVSIPGMYLTDISSDGSKLLLVAPTAMAKVAGFPLKIMDTASGSLQGLNGIEGDDASFRPDGKLVYVDRQDTFFADEDGSHSKKLFSMDGYARGFRFSPDGQRMRFSVNKKLIGRHELWETKADGGGLHRVLTDLKESDGDPCCGAWSADGRYYFFQMTLNGYSRIWAERQEGSFWSRGPSKAVPLTSVPPNFYVEARSPDPSKLIVTTAEPRAELSRYDERSKQFVSVFEGISAGDVEYSRDGKLVAYVRYPEGTLWRAKSDGSEAWQLTGPSLRVALPHWSPDGETIAFSGTRPGRPWNVFLISATGGPAQQVTDGKLQDLDPSWSPDGTKIAYAQQEQVGSEIRYSMKQLDVRSRQSTDFPGTDEVCCPRWSPDGKTLMATHASYDDIVLYDIETAKVTTIVKDLGPTGYMEWSSDGKTILFDTLEVPEPNFYRYHVGSGRMETVVSLKNVRRYYAQFGTWTGMAPDGSPLLVRDVSNDEVYVLDLALP